MGWVIEAMRKIEAPRHRAAPLRIRQLLAGGLNLAGISLVLQLEDDNARLRAKSAPRRKRDG